MNYLALFICCLAFTSKAWSQNNHPVITDLETMSRIFKAPDAYYGPSILWGWDGPVSREVITRDLDQFKSLNIKSVNIEAGYDLPAPYLSDEYFELVKFAIDQARQRDMVVWMIDESKYPSGFAGGKFSRERPDLRMQGLDVYKRVDLTAGQTFSEEVPPVVLSAIAINKGNDTNRLLRIENGRLQWTAPDGEWQIILVRHRFRTSVTRAGNNPTHGKDTMNALCDYLNPLATRQFIEFTHEQYKKHVGSAFGKTFLGFRGDEPDYGFVPWTPALPEEFVKRKGYDVRPWVASFLVKNPTDSMRRVKADYWDVWSDLFGASFFKVQADWCSENQLSYMTHLNHEDKMMALALSGGDFFENLRHVQVPGVDAIWNQIWPGKIADFPKYASSVAHVYGRPRAMSESFAAYNTPPDVNQAKWVTDHQLVRGINLFEWMYWPSSTRGDGKPRGWFGDRKFPQVALYTNRVSCLLANGSPAADIAVYYPTTSEWLGDQEADSSALRLCRYLLENQRDFDFVDDHAIEQVLESTGSGLKNKSGQIYRVILVPSVTTMTRMVLDKLKSFVHSGGKVIFTGKTPALVVERTFLDAGHSFDFPEAVYVSGQSILSHLPDPDFNLKKNNPDIKYNHRKYKDGEIYYIFNEGEVFVETPVTLVGDGKAEIWDALSGEMRNIPSIKSKKHQLTVNLRLAPWETQIIVLSKK